ncbi:MAG: hypothetical protein C5B57_00585 [Blastocatellia bacterium]|nr:MAG: hypothetical protein C5B57_00585 [Blastocatellia bacterium]
MVRGRATGWRPLRQHRFYPGEAGGTARRRAAPDWAACARKNAPATSDSGTAFGIVGYSWFDAHKSFDAVLGQPGGFFFGAGGEFRFRDRIFVQGSLERFKRTGERAFVLDGDVFKLGIPDTVTITSLTFTGGYRFRRRSMTPFVGGGVGRYFFTEKADFADPSENVDEQFASYHVLGGVEWRGGGLLATAFEVQYTHVPDALEDGVAAAIRRTQSWRRRSPPEDSRRPLRAPTPSRLDQSFREGADTPTVSSAGSRRIAARFTLSATDLLSNASTVGSGEATRKI